MMDMEAIDHPGLFNDNDENDNDIDHLGLFNPNSVSVSVSEPVPAQELELIGVDGSE